MATQRTSLTVTTILAAALLTACAGEIVGPGGTDEPAADEAQGGATGGQEAGGQQAGGEATTVLSNQHALDVALEVADVIDIGSNMGGFLRGSVNPVDVGSYGGTGGSYGGTGGSTGAMTPYDLQAPADCTFSHEISMGSVSISGSCVTDNGDRVSGAFTMSIGNECSGFSLDIAYSFEVNRANGDLLDIDGSLRLQPGLQSYFATDFHLLAVDADAHTFEHNANLCIYYDFAGMIGAANGTIVTKLDGAVLHAIAVEDLQKRLCEALPFNGKLRFEHLGKVYEVAFSRAPSGSILVKVYEDGALAEEAEQPWATTGFCGGTAPDALVLDYVTCGGCALPPPSDPTEPPAAPEPQPPTDDGGGDDGGSDDGGDDDGSDDDGSDDDGVIL